MSEFTYTFRGNALSRVYTYSLRDRRTVGARTVSPTRTSKPSMSGAPSPAVTCRRPFTAA
jgi:hypothetical protein